MFNKKQQRAMQALREIEYHLSNISNHSIAFKKSQNSWNTITSMKNELIPLLEKIEYSK